MKATSVASRWSLTRSMNDLVAKPVSLFTAVERQRSSTCSSKPREADVSIGTPDEVKSDGVCGQPLGRGRSDAACSGRLDWVYERLLLVGAATKENVAFTLLHEFDEAHDRFDWHVDTKPNDGKSRTTNLNVMLSEPRVDFEAALQVGPPT